MAVLSISVFHKYIACISFLSHIYSLLTISVVWEVNIVTIFSYLFCIDFASNTHLPVPIIGKNTANAETQITHSI